jgi:hypothetical protein
MQELVEDRSGEHVVSEHAVPFGEGLVGGDDHRAAYVTPGEDWKTMRAEPN